MCKSWKVEDFYLFQLYYVEFIVWWDCEGLKRGSFLGFASRKERERERKTEPSGTFDVHKRTVKLTVGYTRVPT